MNDTLSSTSTDLSQQVAALQRQVFLLLMALIVVTATVVFYLYYESRIESKDLEANRPRAMQIIKAYNENALVIQAFNKKLINYGLAHPNFQPILRKYGWVPAGSAAPTAPAP